MQVEELKRYERRVEKSAAHIETGSKGGNFRRSKSLELIRTEENSNSLYINAGTLAQTVRQASRSE